MKKNTSFTQHNNKDLHCKSFTKASLPQVEVEEYDELEQKKRRKDNVIKTYNNFN
jgi:ribosomal protein L44E